MRRLRLDLMPGFTMATSLSDLAALDLRILTWEPRWPNAARASDRSAHAPSAQPIDTAEPNARQFHCPLTLAGAHLRYGPPGSPRIAQHHGRPRNDSVRYRLLYDGPGPDVRLIGVEYLVSDEVYRQMPAEEKLDWHEYHDDGDDGFVGSRGRPGPRGRRLAPGSAPSEARSTIPGFRAAITRAGRRGSRGRTRAS